MGYNVICSPVLDLCGGNYPCGGTTRSFGPDKEPAAYAPYVPRVLLGLAANDCVMHGLEILAGNAEAKGTLPYNVIFHKKGDLFV